MDPRAIFHNARYLRSTFRRLEHLAELSLPLEWRTVLEIGAGIGDFTSFFLDKNCRVTSTEPREENVAIFRARYAEAPLWEPGRLRIVQSAVGDLEKNGIEPHDVVVCQQVLNFVRDPESAIAALASYANEMLLLEAACDSGEGRDGEEIRCGTYDANDPGGSIAGVSYLPTRRWLFNRLKRHFPYVYVALLQADFERFRLYWGRPDTGRGHDRVFFVASRAPIDNAFLADFVPTVQFRRLTHPSDLLLPDGMRRVKTVFGPMATVQDDRTWQEPEEAFNQTLHPVKEGDVVYDLGAGIGMYAVAFGIAVGEHGTVIASERRERHSAALERNVRSHGTRNVKCNAPADGAARPAALLRVGTAGLSDADWRIAMEILERDEPIVHAEDSQRLRSALARFGYTRHANVYVPKGKRGLA